jgi:hypothetical protein
MMQRYEVKLSCILYSAVLLNNQLRIHEANSWLEDWNFGSYACYAFCEIN